MRWFVVLVLIMFTGCNNLSKKELQLRHTGIIDACYSVIEFNSNNKYQKIKSYIEFNIEKKHLTKEQGMILIKCLKRTENSIRWKHE